MKAKQNVKATPVATPTMTLRAMRFAERSGELSDKLEGLSAGAAPKLAVLIRWSEAESFYEPGGCSPALDQLAWRGMKEILSDVLRDVEELQRTSGISDGPFAMLTDEAAEKGDV
jgi:hypothetical protein